jgi:electron transfer flavoprotein alpha subunit
VPGEQSVYVVVEQSGEKVDDTSLEALSCGHQLADKLGGKVRAVFIGNNRELARALGDYGADKVYMLDSPLLQEYCAQLYVEALSKCIEENNPAIVLFGATLMSRELAPRLAARLKTGLISECINLALNKEGLLQGTKLTHGGKLSSTIVCPAATTKMATIKPGIMTISRSGNSRQSDIIMVTAELNQRIARVVMKEVVRAAPENIGLDEADIIVSGGKGVGTQENFRLLERLARRLGGVVGGSLGAVDEGWLPRKRLVGQTGTTVTPKLYIACGISGSVYHVLGMKDSDFVIAINKDPAAPIFKVADMSIIGDVVEVISAILRRLDALAESEAM